MPTKRKGRVSKTRKHKVHAPSCPFWVFVLFICAWFVLAAVVIALFYSGIRKPVRQVLPIHSDPIYQERTYEGFDPLQYPEPAAPDVDGGEGGSGNEGGAMMEEKKMNETLMIASCRPLEETDTETSAVRRWIEDRDGQMRELGQRCALGDGRQLISFTYNATVPFSTRLYLEQVVAIADASTLEAQSFYCHTSPRGTAVTLVNGVEGVEAHCRAPVEDGQRVRVIALEVEPSLRIDLARTFKHSLNQEGYRFGTGDTMREFCVTETIGDETLPEWFGSEGVTQQTGSVCRLRNGVWVVAEGRGGVIRVDKQAGEVLRTSDDVIAFGPYPKIISTLGSDIDIVDSFGEGFYQWVKLYRVNARTMSSSVLVNREGDVR
ncbi:hypothetical protein GF380_05860 [Candidatus Uhrbacteria bacterium]|nr:hypothetical protein [Candidatus Uhrbacteria bacterium]MBD3284516.1 hypothetical protein [Candidatus Uhrbacteria bacterium]